MNTDITLLPSADASPAQGGGGCGCGCSGHEEAATPTLTTAPLVEEILMTSQTFGVDGMTCGHCAHAVTEEIKALPGVTDVHVDLVAGGTSTVTVTATAPVAAEHVAGALDEAGDYTLAN